MKQSNLTQIDSKTRGRIQTIVDRIVEVADPEKIFLFGSYAIGEGREESDYDFLVIKNGDYHKGELTEDIYMNLVGVGAPVDVVIVTPEEVDRYKDSPSLVIKSALEKGKLIYERGSKRN